MEIAEATYLQDSWFFGSFPYVARVAKSCSDSGFRWGWRRASSRWWKVSLT